MFLAGARYLEAKKEWINELNVFPVPDGDTGTNMTMTIQSAAAEVSAIDELTMAKLAKAMSSGSLRGARGNSGVILSQLLRGFCKSIRENEILDAQILCAAFGKAVETAYKAVMKPKEGTILTVARGMAEKASELYADHPDLELEDFLTQIIAYGDEVLDQTPEMLPVLKEAGVVDSGGQGLMQIMKGALDCFCGKEIIEESEELPKAEEIHPGYCVEFVLKKCSDPETAVSALEELAEKDEFSAVIREGDSIRVHMHSKHPGTILEKAISFGILAKLKTESLAEEHHETVVTAEELETLRKEKEEPRKEVGFVAVAAGSGMCDIFRDLGADQVIEGGQTMNPSTNDVLNAIQAVHAETVFVFPNNKNIILAASQAQDMCKDCKVIVIPSKTIPQGITALIGYAYEKSPEENESMMYDAIRQVKTCQLTYAIRDTHIADQEIHEGDIMGVGDKGILAVGQDLIETTICAAEKMVDETSELLSVYAGQDVTDEETMILIQSLEDRFPECEVQLSQGDQPVYYYILSVE